MTEAEWLAAADPRPMLAFLKGRVGERKLRLFACACCRRIWSALSDGASRRSVEVAELYADEDATGRELRTVQEAAVVVARANRRYPFAAAEEVSKRYALADNSEGREYYADSAVRTAYYAMETAYQIAYEAAATADRAAFATGMNAKAAESAAQANLLRDIFGTPFCPVSLDSAWRTPPVLALASGTYAERAFDRLPILADALQDAGCESDDVLGHCLGPGPHVRGCWVVDLILGKS